MSFYSLEFLFLFLPATVAIFYFVARRLGHNYAIAFLILASLTFYGLGNWHYLPLLLGSIGFNYAVGSALRKNRSVGLLWFGIAVNLALLSCFKYWTFWSMEGIALPLAISFYTFQQVTWLIESRTGKDGSLDSFWRYVLFVTFFPHLISGPIVRPNETPAQFRKPSTFRLNWTSISAGIAIFVIGFAKKVFIADGLSVFTDKVFSDAALGDIGLVNAWLGAFAFTFQVYFDFSGYSDMAIGVARMFNIRLPMNFNAPLKATNIADLWKAWHMTMTRFFQSYIYAPLSVICLRYQNKHGIRGNYFMYIGTFATLLLIGLWHGASWTFIVFGFMQGCAIIASHLWRDYRKTRKIRPMPEWLGLVLTFLFFAISCVTYRAENLEVAASMYHAMFAPKMMLSLRVKPTVFLLLAAAALISFFAPNTQQIMRRYSPVLDQSAVAKLGNKGRLNALLRSIVWRPTALWGIFMLATYIYCINAILNSHKVQSFIYFKF